jgi:YD repeat-containing protein
MIYSDLLIEFSSFDLDNDLENPAEGGRGFNPAGPEDPVGGGCKLRIPGFKDSPQSVPTNPPGGNPDDPPVIAGGGCPGPAIEPQYYQYIRNPSLQRNPQPMAAQYGTALAYKYSASDSTERLTLDWVDDGQGNAVRRLFVTDAATGVIYEFEDYAGSSTFYGAKWRIIRFFFGPYASPDWERRYIYDSTGGGHGGMIESVDERGVRTFYEWTDLGTQTPMWRITKISKAQPVGASWGSYDWSQLDVNLEYDSAGYLVAIVRKPRLVRHDVTNKSGDGNLNAQAETIAPITRFAYDSSFPLKRPLKAVYEDLDGGGTDPTFSDCRLIVSYTYDSTPGADPFRVVSKTTGPDRNNNYVTDTYAYPSSTVTTWTDPLGVVREYTHERFGNDWTDPETSQTYSLKHLPESRRVTKYKVTDPGTIRQGYFQHSTKVTTFAYGSCGCGAPEVIIDPKGVKYQWSYDPATGRPLSLTVTGVGGAVSRTWTWTYEPSSAHYRIRNRLKSVTDPTNYQWTYHRAATTAGSSLSIKSGSTTLYSSETNKFGHPLWIEGESFSIDGGGSSKGRVEFVYGTSPAAVDYWLLKEEKRVGASPVIKGEYTYEGPGYLKTYKDAKGRITTLTSNYNGQPVSVTLPVTQSGYVTSAGGLPTYGGQVDLEYNLRGRVSVVRAKAYQKDGSAYAKADVEQRFLYDGMGRLAYRKVDQGTLSTAGAQWSVTTYDYDPAGRPLGVAKTNGESTAFEIDGYGLPYRVLEKINGGQTRVRKYGFDENGNLLEVKRSKILGQPYSEQTVSFVVDAYGRLEKTNYPDGTVVERDFDKSDRLMEVRLKSGTSSVAKSVFTYDSIAKRLVEVMDIITAGNKTRKRIYAYNGALLSRITDNDTTRSKSFFHDGFGRTLRVVDSLLGSGSGNEFIREYDIDDTVKTVLEKVIKNQGQAGNVTETYKKSYQYDAWGRLILAQDWGDLAQNPTAPLTETRFGRDSIDNLVWTKRPKASSTTDDSQVVELSHDALGRVLQQIIHPRKGSSLNSITLGTVYNDNPGNGLATTISKTDGLGHLSEYDYDYGGRLTQRRLPGHGSGGKTWTYSYDVEGRLLQWVDGNSATVKLGYDSVGRLDVRYLSTMGAQALSAMCTNETFAYDNISRRNQAKTFQYVWPDSQGPNPAANLLVQIDWSVDALGRKISESFGFGDDPQHLPMVTKTFASTWSFGGNKEDFGFRRGLSTPNGFSMSFTPDNIGRLSQTSLSGNGLTNLGLAEYRFAGARPVNRIHRLWSGSNRFETNYLQRPGIPVSSRNQVRNRHNERSHDLFADPDP